MRNRIIYFASLLCAMLVSVSCSNEKTLDTSDIFALNVKEINLNYDEVSASITFRSRANWNVTVLGGTIEGKEWITLDKTGGIGSDKCTIGITTKINATKVPREAVIQLSSCGVVKEVKLTQGASSKEILTPDDVPNYSKFFANSDVYGMDMFSPESKWSFYRYRQSEHFFVFWEPGFGNDPATTDVPAMRVDVEDLLAKAEQFYNTNINMLKMASLGKSQLDNYKMQIYLLYQDEWLATGSGYDNTIGALWVNPSTCQPVGSTIAHEIGHSFQYQVYCDQVYNGAPSDFTTGFRYGYPGSNGGNGYWEQSAQWQSLQDYPAEALDSYHMGVWLANYHRAFENEWMRYASYYLQYFWTGKHGIEAFGRIWKESKYPEDAIMTYTRLYNGGDWSKTADELYEYAAHTATFDIPALTEYMREDHLNKYKTNLLEIGDNWFQVAYGSCVQSSGFNVIRLNVPENGGAVACDFVGLPSNSPLAKGDAGQYMKSESYVGTVSNYNGTVSDERLGWHWGFVAYKNDGTRVYGDAAKGKEGRVTFQCPEGTKYLYLVVAGTPTSYNQHPWDEDELTDEQLPYKVKFAGTNVYGYIDIDPSVDPTSVNIPVTLQCNAAEPGYEQGVVNFTETGILGQICQAFVMTSSQLASCTQAPSGSAEPKEGMVTFGLLQPDGSIAYTYTANTGFYITADGSLGSWGNNDPIYVEYEEKDFLLHYGHKPNCSVAGTTYNVKPCLVYVKNGKQYVATFDMTMKY
ncbi:MAG: DUF4859 domain-containing protein [Bacteroidaceae bacterium]|nr:DUF4859 domain-containing protein [Bacteroidaceae bacterium]